MKRLSNHKQLSATGAICNPSFLSEGHTATTAVSVRQKKKEVRSLQANN
jgi:hypothetical protein